MTRLPPARQRKSVTTSSSASSKSSKGGSWTLGGGLGRVGRAIAGLSADVAQGAPTSSLTAASATTPEASAPMAALATHPPTGPGNAG
eukprot:10003681-Lingulodinium_polyedra.AAC.1